MNKAHIYYFDIVLQTHQNQFFQRESRLNPLPVFPAYPPARTVESGTAFKGLLHLCCRGGTKYGSGEAGAGRRGSLLQQGLGLRQIDRTSGIGSSS